MCCMHAARWKYRTQKFAKIRHLRTIAQLCRAVSSQLRHISTITKKVETTISPPHVLTICWTSARITAEIGLPVWGTPANFNGFRVLASILQRRRSTDVNQTLHNDWPSPALVHYIYILRGSSPNRIVPDAKFTLRPSLAFSYICSVTARHLSTGRQPNFAAFSRGRHLYSAGRPSRGHRPTF